MKKMNTLSKIIVVLALFVFAIGRVSSADVPPAPPADENSKDANRDSAHGSDEEASSEQSPLNLNNDLENRARNRQALRDQAAALEASVTTSLFDQAEAAYQNALIKATQEREKRTRETTETEPTSSFVFNKEENSSEKENPIDTPVNKEAEDAAKEIPTANNDDAKEIPTSNNDDAKDDKNTNTYTSFMRKNGTIFIFFCFGLYIVILFSVLYMNNMEYQKYNTMLHEFIRNHPSFKKIFTISKTLFFSVLAAVYTFYVILIRPSTRLQEIVCFSLVPLVGLLIFASTFSYRMNQAGVPLFMQIALIVVQIIVVFVMGLLGSGLFNYKKAADMFKKNPIVATIISVTSISFIYTLLRILLPAQYEFCADLIYFSGIYAFVYGVMVGMQILMKLIKWMRQKHVSEESAEKHKGREPNFENNPVFYAIISFAFGIVSLLVFTLVLYFEKEWLHKAQVSAILWGIAKLKSVSSLLGISSIIEVVKTKVSNLVEVSNVLSAPIN
ncbi:hypothetical protein NEMIN01_1484 [Nematocida minor]|uniref:uncharacterized protein n=1 Tax=Nematocida minor TaxID=1912983 RepID=UPI00222007C1|nr:uncharacterized protein NEMIN01_1484 [Nematocida minor]KAI5191325.1 hypothetical protein NEMIN01_1484 [Nematocida minor]